MEMTFFFFFFGEKEKEKTKSWAERHSKLLLNGGKAKIKG